MGEIKIPSIVLAKYDELYDLCENKHKNGVLNPADVADFSGVDVNWLRNTIYTGDCPFGWGSNKMVGRGSSCIHVLAFFNYMTQGHLFRVARDKHDIERLCGR